MIEDPDQFAPVFIEAGADQFRSIRKPARIWTGRSE